MANQMTPEQAVAGAAKFNEWVKNNPNGVVPSDILAGVGQTGPNALKYITVNGVLTDQNSQNYQASLQSLLASGNYINKGTAQNPELIPKGSPASRTLGDQTPLTSNFQTLASQNVATSIPDSQSNVNNSNLGTSGNAGTPPAMSISINRSRGLPDSGSTGNPEYDTLLKQMQGYLDQLQKNGQVLNPNVQLTPEKIAEFTNQASQQIHPYYATQLKAATGKFLTGLGYNSNQLLNNEQQTQQAYTKNLRTLGETAADRGFAQSGGRMLDEQQLASDTQNSLDQARNALYNTDTNQAQNFAQIYGGANVPNAPTLNGAPRVLAGQSQFDTSSPSRGLYQLSPDIYSSLIGSEQNSEKSATDTLTGKLGENYTQGLANQQTRALTT